MKSLRVIPKIADFGSAQPGDSSEPLRFPIQPPLFHAPEVLLGTDWTYSADIWNLGVLIWNMMEGKDLFKHIRSSKGDYDARAHIAEMIAKLCHTAREYFGGPFFNSEGEFMHKDLIPTDVSLEGLVYSLEGDDKQLFLNFVRKMLQWLPEHRKTAKELLEDPWLVL
ncbi:hypothetical protein DTO021D3_8558 [Paecilomyces variotii]|nr:hypothetical protein DTO032I3_5216 [Paecilomyces variotii]KAJ9274541.1 hypothetical protein DTO021D3_8558 [Paecilomyces variotii]KAJ9285160.1 hypothetical protein DTO021C3_7203 [Paecilomyces variotii]KAJ9342273.1 hypothetical protein DTO027B6_5202 [Paecilomyces variotii]KAJ9378100.1 hypothetical protein DTO032I4_7827 [Paecilomyces variotii]